MPINFLSIKMLRLCMGIFIFSLFFISAGAYTVNKNDLRQRGTQSSTYADIFLFNHGQDMLFNTGFLSARGSPDIFPYQFQNNLNVSPVWSDLNDDGHNYLAACNGAIITIFENITLGTYQQISNSGLCIDLQIYKYSGSNYLIATFVNSSYRVKTYNYLWDGTQFNLDSSYISGFTKDPYSSFGLKCDVNKKCFSVFSSTYAHDGDIFALNYYNIGTAVFNSTYTTSGGGNPYDSYLPNLMDIVSYDIDVDGNLEFIFTSVNAATMKLLIHNIRYNDTNVNNIYTYQYAISGRGGTSGLYERSLTNYVTSPIRGYFCQKPGSQLAIGWHDDTQHIKIGCFYWENNQYNLYNSHTTNNILWGGYHVTALSNMIQSKLFTGQQGNSNPDYCIIGYTESTNNTILFCANDFQLGWLVSSNRLYHLDNTTENIFPGYQTAAAAVYAVSAENSADSNLYITDYMLLTGTYGVSDYNPITATGNLIKLYSNPVGPGILIPVSLKNSPFYDMLSVNSNSMFYIDDTTQPAELKASIGTNYKITPCVTQQWQINSTVTILAWPQSWHNINQVHARAYLYYGEPNQQFINWTNFANSGSYHSFEFKANVTTGNSILRIEAIDTQDTGIDIVNLGFTVGPIGVTGADCATYGLEINPPAANTSGIYFQNATLRDNNIKKAVFSLSQQIGIPAILFFLIIMIGIDIVIFISGMQSPQLRGHLNAFLIFILTMDFFMIITATLIGILSPAFIISLMALLLIAAALMIAKHFSKTTTG